MNYNISKKAWLHGNQRLSDCSKYIACMLVVLWQLAVGQKWIWRTPLYWRTRSTFTSRADVYYLHIRPPRNVVFFRTYSVRSRGLSPYLHIPSRVSCPLLPTRRLSQLISPIYLLTPLTRLASPIYSQLDPFTCHINLWNNYGPPVLNTHKTWHTSRPCSAVFCPGLSHNGGSQTWFKPSAVWVTNIGCVWNYLWGCLRPKGSTPETHRI